MRNLNPAWIPMTVVMCWSCGQHPEDTNASGRQGHRANVVAVQAPTESLADGIDFRRARLPEFVTAVKGLSGREAFGRWSEGPEVRIDLNMPIPRDSRISMKIAAFPPQVGKPARVTIGRESQEFKVTTTRLDAMDEVVLDFGDVGAAKSILISIPDPKSPKDLGLGTDTRPLAFAFGELRVIQR